MFFLCLLLLVKRPKCILIPILKEETIIKKKDEASIHASPRDSNHVYTTTLHTHIIHCCRLFPQSFWHRIPLSPYTRSQTYQSGGDCTLFTSLLPSFPLSLLPSFSPCLPSFSPCLLSLPSLPLPLQNSPFHFLLLPSHIHFSPTN